MCELYHMIQIIIINVCLNTHTHTKKTRWFFGWGKYVYWVEFVELIKADNFKQKKHVGIQFFPEFSFYYTHLFYFYFKIEQRSLQIFTILKHHKLTGQLDIFFLFQEESLYVFHILHEGQEGGSSCILGRSAVRKNFTSLFGGLISCLAELYDDI